MPRLLVLEAEAPHKLPSLFEISPLLPTGLFYRLHSYPLFHLLPYTWSGLEGMSSGFWPDLQYSRHSVTFLSPRERTNSRASWKALYSLSWLATLLYQASRRIHAIYPYKQYWGPSVYLAACTRICGIHTTLHNPVGPESERTHEPPQRSENAYRHFSHCQYRASRPY